MKLNKYIKFIKNIFKTIFDFILIILISILTPMSVLYYVYEIYSFIDFSYCGIDNFFKVFEFLNYYYLECSGNLYKQKQQIDCTVSKYLCEQDSIVKNNYLLKINSNYFYQKKTCLNFVNYDKSMSYNTKLTWKYCELPWEQIASNFDYVINFKILNSSSEILNEELDNYEWFTIFKAEIDTATTVPLDLAVKYGKEYMGGLVNHKINTSRQLYYRGLTHDIEFKVPLSGTLSEPDTSMAMLLSPNFKIIDFENLNKKVKLIEKYNEFDINSLELSSGGFSDLDLSTLTDTFGFYNNIKYSIDNLNKYTVSIDKNPGSVQDFLTWRDSITDFDKETWSDVWKTKNNIDKKVKPDTLLSENLNNKKYSTINPFKFLLTNETQNLLNKNNFLQDNLNIENRKEILNYLNNNNYSSIKVLKHSGTSVDDLNDIKYLINSISDEIELSSKIISNLLYNRGSLYNLELNYKKNYTFSILGNTFFDFFILLLRNPAIDFSYINSIGLHYDTLDKFWDKRPSTTNWLWSDILSYNPQGGYVIRNSKKLLNEWKYNYLTEIGNNKINEKLQVSTVEDTPIFLKVYNQIIEIITDIDKNIIQKINLINNEIIYENKLILTNNIENNKNIKKNLEIFTKKNLSFFLKKNLETYENNEITVRTLNIIKNIINNIPWAIYTFGDFVYVDIREDEINISRDFFKKIIINNLFDKKIDKNTSVRLMNSYDLIFGKKQNIKVNKKKLEILYMLGLVELDELTLGVLPISPEIMLILNIIDKKNNLDLNKLNDILNTELFWKNFKKKLINFSETKQYPEKIIIDTVTPNIDKINDSKIFLKYIKNYQTNYLNTIGSLKNKEKIHNDFKYSIFSHFEEKIIKNNEEDYKTFYDSKIYYSETYLNTLLKKNKIKIMIQEFKKKKEEIIVLKKNYIKSFLPIYGEIINTYQPIHFKIWTGTTKELNIINLKIKPLMIKNVGIVDNFNNLGLNLIKKYSLQLIYNLSYYSTIINFLKLFFLNILNNILIFFYYLGSLNLKFNFYTILNNIYYNVIDFGFIKINLYNNKNNNIKTNLLLLKKSINKFLEDTEKSYYRVELPFTNYMYFREKNDTIKKLKTIDDVKEFTIIKQAVPVFFTKAPFKVIVGEFPNFGEIRQARRIISEEITSILDDAELYIETTKTSQNMYIERKILPRPSEFFGSLIKEWNESLELFMDINIITNWFNYMGKVDYVSDNLILSIPVWLGYWLYDNSQKLAIVIFEWHTANFFYYFKFNFEKLIILYKFLNFFDNLKNINNNKFSEIQKIREMLGLEPELNLKENLENTYKIEEIKKLNQQLLTSFKFFQIPNDTIFVESEKFPTIENFKFNDIKYLKKTNTALRWYLEKDNSDWLPSSAFEESELTSKYPEIYSYSDKYDIEDPEKLNPNDNFENWDYLKFKKVISGNCEIGRWLNGYGVSKKYLKTKDILNLNINDMDDLFTELTKCVEYSDNMSEFYEDVDNLYDIIDKVKEDVEELYFKTNINIELNLKSLLEYIEYSLLNYFLEYEELIENDELLYDTDEEELIDFYLDSKYVDHIEYESEINADMFETVDYLDEEEEMLDMEYDLKENNKIEINKNYDNLENIKYLNKVTELAYDTSDNINYENDMQLDDIFEEIEDEFDEFITHIDDYYEEEDLDEDLLELGIESISHYDNDDFENPFDFDEIWDDNIKNIDSMFNTNELKLRSGKITKNYRKVRKNDEFINRITNEVSPWEILDTQHLPEIVIPGNINIGKFFNENSLDNTTLESLNYQINGGFTIFDLILKLQVSDEIDKSFFSKIMYHLLVETDNLKYPWLNSKLQISKKKNYLSTVLQNNLDTLMLDSVVDAKNNINWNRIDYFGENFEKNIKKKNTLNLMILKN